VKQLSVHAKTHTEIIIIITVFLEWPKQQCHHEDHCWNSQHCAVDAGWV